MDVEDTISADDRQLILDPVSSALLAAPLNPAMRASFD